MATYDVPAAYQRLYSDGIQLIYQQLQSVFRGNTRYESDFVGKRKAYAQFATIEMTKRKDLYENTDFTIPKYPMRAVFAQPYYSALPVDWMAQMNTSLDLASPFMQSQRAAIERVYDDVCISAFGSTAYQTDDTETDIATTLTSFQGTWDTATGTEIIAYNRPTIGGQDNPNTGMGKAKLLRARTILNKNQVPAADRYVVWTSTQEEDLLSTTEPTSRDFNVVQTLVEGTLGKTTWIGFKYLLSERLLVEASTSYRLCYAFHKEAILFAAQKELMASVDRLPTRQNVWQHYVACSFGSARMQEAGVVQLKCAE